MDKTKVCIGCLRELSEAKFKNDRRKCNTCRHASESDSVKARHRQSKARLELKGRSENPVKYLLKYARRRAEKRGIEFTITEADLILPSLCPILEIPLYIGTNALKENSPSIDRVDNTRGYVPDNVRIISTLANTMKGNASAEMLLAFSRNIQAYVSSAK